MCYEALRFIRGFYDLFLFIFTMFYSSAATDAPALRKGERYRRELSHLPLRLGGSPCQIFCSRGFAFFVVVEVCFDGNSVAWPLRLVRSEKLPASSPRIRAGWGTEVVGICWWQWVFFFWAKCAAEWSPALDRLPIVTVAILAQGKQSG